MAKKQIDTMDYALYYLHRTPKTKKELKAKLLEKGYVEKEVDATVAQLEKMNLVNDERFAELYINSELVRKGKPLFRVKGKLLQKGIDPELIDQVVGAMGHEIEGGIKDKLLKEIEKLKAKGMEGYDIMVKLHQKGYTVDQIREAVAQ